MSIPLALYVHLPWCVRKCPYCDFNSHVHRGVLPQADYVAALLQDLATDAPRARGRPVSSVFFGGGTPSLFAPEEIAAFLAGARERVAIAPDAEVTLEANPGTIEHGRFAGYRDAGVNRVSLGAQSFSPAQLRRLGRIHEARDTARAVDELAGAGLSNYNLDLMWALPEQTPAEALEDVATAARFAPPHLSHYQLTLEPGTVFHARPPTLPDEDSAEAIQALTHAHLAAGGYRQYEVSAWAKEGAECRHNLNYWRYGDYLGVGAGAHGKLTDAAGVITRTEKVKQPREYLERAAGESALGTTAEVAPAERPFEFMLNALRLTEGFRVEDFEARTSLPIASVGEALERAKGRGLLEASGNGFRPTALGQRFLNDLTAFFLPNPRSRAIPELRRRGSARTPPAVTHRA